MKRLASLTIFIFMSLFLSFEVHAASTAEKMAIVDDHRFSAGRYQVLIDSIREECPNHSEEEIGDIVCYTYEKLRKMGLNDSLYETLLRIKERSQLCKSFSLEEIVAAYVALRMP